MVKILRETKKKKKKKKIKENIERQFFALGLRQNESKQHPSSAPCLSCLQIIKGVVSVFSKRVHPEATFYDL